MLRVTSLFLAVIIVATLVPGRARAQSNDFGKWKTLFNGKDLAGWQNAKPKHQPRNNKGINNWAVRDGTLTNKGDGADGNDICTTEEFEDYELEIEYKIPKGGNSGVYLRGQIEIQIFDSAAKKDSELKPVDAGAIYGGNFVALTNAQRPAGEWNSYRVLHIGHRITVWHNGVLIQDNIYQDRRTGGAMTVKPSGDPLTTRRGPLMMQGDHSKVWYRNIRVRPLLGDGWKALWNGKDLTQFHARGSSKAKDGLRWEVKDHAFTNSSCGGKGHDLWTKGKYGNFLALYSYKADTQPPADCKDRSGNSGFYLRGQWEIQIHGRQRLKSKHHDGALYSVHPVAAKASHGANRWNHMAVKLVGKKMWVWQNGTLIHDGVTSARRTDSNRPTLDFHRAAFKLQGDHGKVWFSNLFIKELPDSAGRL